MLSRNSAHTRTFLCCPVEEGALKRPLLHQKIISPLRGHGKSEITQAVKWLPSNWSTGIRFRAGEVSTVSRPALSPTGNPISVDINAFHVVISVACLRRRDFCGMFTAPWFLWHVYGVVRLCHLPLYLHIHSLRTFYLPSSEIHSMVQNRLGEW
jgi:hypothetical protein